MSDQLPDSERPTAVPCPRCEGRGHITERVNTPRGLRVYRRECWLCRGAEMLSVPEYARWIQRGKPQEPEDEDT